MQSRAAARPHSRESARPPRTRGSIACGRTGRSGQNFQWGVHLSGIVAYASGGIGCLRMWMQVDLSTGLMRGVRQIASPNCDARPAEVEADLIVVHGISLPPGEFGGPWIERLFTNTLPAEVHPYFAEVCSR